MPITPNDPSQKTVEDNGSDELAHDRGFSTLANTGTAAPLKKVIAAVVVLVLAACVIGGFFWFKSNNKNSQSPQKKPPQITSTVPKQQFDHWQPAPERPSTQVQNEPTIEPRAAEKIAITIDKSRAPMMVTKPHRARGEDNGNSNPAKSSSENDGALNGLLNATATPLVTASQLKNRAYLLAKGSFIDCVLHTRLDSTVPGMTSCVVTRNIYSDTGKVVLIERGSTVSGEYQSNLKQGQARIFVLWNRIKTPNGVVISLNSPGTDPLGGSGIPGYVDTHFWERFGGAMLLSLLQDTAATAATSVNKNTNENVTLTLDNTGAASQALAVEALRNTINIPPTLYKNQGDRVGIYVARDLDFSSVYALNLQ